MSGTIVHLIRHADYPLLGHAIAGRIEGYGLSPAGRDQAEALANATADLPLAAVLTSPLQRARETAAPLASRRGVSARVDDAFTEIDYGDWSGLSFENLHEQPGWRRYNQFRSLAEIPGGETVVAAQARAVSGLMRLAKDHPDSQVAIVSHAEIVRSLLAFCLGVPIELARRLEIGPASRSIVAIYQDDLQVLGVNLPPG